MWQAEVAAADMVSGALAAAAGYCGRAEPAPAGSDGLGKSLPECAPPCVLNTYY